jgi:hypothetical protein
MIGYRHDNLSAPALTLLARCCANPGWTIADGEEDACRELGMAGLCWWQHPEEHSAWPAGMRGHTVITPYPDARHIPLAELVG